MLDLYPKSDGSYELEITKNITPKGNCMTHPPIPPNCDRFRMFQERAQFLYGVALDARRGGQHFIDDIAALNPDYCIFKDCRNAARCGWLDEVDRLWAEHHQKLSTLPVEQWPETNQIKEQAQQAERNAEAWRLWGKQKHPTPEI